MALWDQESDTATHSPQFFLMLYHNAQGIKPKLIGHLIGQGLLSSYLPISPYIHSLSNPYNL